MKLFLPLITALAATAGPALAHPGIHTHPHGAEIWLPLVLGLVAFGVTAGVAWMRK